MIAEHHRANSERTDERLYSLAALVAVLDIVVDEHPALMSNSRETTAVRIMLRQVQEAVEKLERAHNMEWVGIGGRCDTLTAAEIAEAKGEPAEVAA